RDGARHVERVERAEDDRAARRLLGQGRRRGDDARGAPFEPAAPQEHERQEHDPEDDPDADRDGLGQVHVRTPCASAASTGAPSSTVARPRRNVATTARGSSWPWNGVLVLAVTWPAPSTTRQAAG